MVTEPLTWRWMLVIVTVVGVIATIWTNWKYPLPPLPLTRDQLVQRVRKAKWKLVIYPVKEFDFNNYDRLVLRWVTLICPEEILWISPSDFLLLVQTELTRPDGFPYLNPRKQLADDPLSSYIIVYELAAPPPRPLVKRLRNMVGGVR